MSKDKKEKFTKSRVKMPLDFYVERIYRLQSNPEDIDTKSVELLFERAKLDGISKSKLDKALRDAEQLNNSGPEGDCK